MKTPDGLLVLPSSVLDTSLRIHPMEIAEVVGVVTTIRVSGRTETRTYGKSAPMSESKEQ